MEMNVGMLKQVIENLMDSTPVFVTCQGNCNYDFKNKRPCDKTDTFAIVFDDKLFITDDYAVEVDNNGNTI